MKTMYLGIAVLLAFGNQARAENVVYSIACGDDRDQGYKVAEVALADDLDSTIHLYLDGRQMPDERVDMGNLEEGWLLTLFPEKGKESRKFVFSEKTKTVQEYLIKANGKQKEVGKPMPCLITDES